MQILKAYKIDRDGTVSVEEGPEDFWMDENIDYAETETPLIPGHTVFFDDNAISQPGHVRMMVGGVEVPLPAWFLGVEGEGTRTPDITPEDLQKAIKIPS